MDNSVLPETKTLVFSIFSLVKIWKSYVPNVQYVRARPKKISRQFVVHIIKRTLHVGLKIWILFFIFLYLSDLYSQRTSL
jgi:hypothetical protein